MTATWQTAASGVFQEWDRTPPPFAFLVAAIVALACAMSFSRFGARIASTIPVWGLVLVQAFRLPLELAMHGMYARGIMPVQMSYSGLNFDIVTGATAIPVAVLAALGYAGRGIVITWNILGLALLINVVTVAILGTPRFRYFGDQSSERLGHLSAVCLAARRPGPRCARRASGDFQSPRPTEPRGHAVRRPSVAAGIICCSRRATESVEASFIGDRSREPL